MLCETRFFFFFEELPLSQWTSPPILSLNILYNAYCFVHKHHERTFLRRKPCYRRRSKTYKKSIQYGSFFFQQRKIGKNFSFPRLFFPVRFYFNFLLEIICERQKKYFSVEIIFVLSLSPLSHCRLIWAVVTPSLVIYTRKETKKNLVVLFVLFVFLLLFFCFYGPPIHSLPGFVFFFFFPKKLFSKVAPSAIISKQQRCHHQFLIGVSCSLTKRGRVFCWHVNLIQTEKKKTSRLVSIIPFFAPIQEKCVVCEEIFHLTRWIKWCDGRPSLTV